MAEREWKTRLPEAELDVMLALWSEGRPAGKGRIAEILAPKRGWSASTVQVLLNRLMERGFVGCGKEKRFNLYYPLIGEQDYRRAETRTFLERIHAGSLSSLIATLVQTKDITEEDIAELEAIIRKGGEQ